MHQAIGLGPPTREDLEESRNMLVPGFQYSFILTPSSYNNFPEDSEQPIIGAGDLRILAGIFVRHNAQHHFGIHLLHKHHEIDHGKVLVRQNHNQPRCSWTITAEIQALDPSEVYGYILVLRVDGLYPSEFQKGHAPVSTIASEFSSELVEFIRTKNWENVIGLEILDQSPPLEMTEFEIGNGTIMVDSLLVKGCNPYRHTGWRFEDVDGTPRVCDDGRTAHGKGPDGNHITAVTKLKEWGSFEHVQKILRENGLLS